MRRLRFAGKFALIALVLLLPLGSVTAGLLTASSTEIRITEREHAGVEVILTMDRLLVDLSTYLDAIALDAIAIDGTPGTPAPDLGPALAAVGRATADDRLPDELDADWEAYRAQVQAVVDASQPPKVVRLALLVQNGAALVHRAGVLSHLSLDSVSRSYDLQQALVGDVPRLLAAAATLHLRVAHWSEAPPVDRSLSFTRAGVEVAVVVAQLTDTVALPAFAPISSGGRPVLRVVRDLEGRSAAMARTIQLTSGDPTADTAALAEKADDAGVVAGVRLILDPVAAELTRLLEVRLEEARDLRNTPLVLTGIALVITSYLLLALGHSTLRSLRDVTDDLESAAAATPLLDRAVTGRDELTTIGRAARRAHEQVSALVSDLQQTAGQLEHRAFHDDLSGLPNRALFLERLGAALATAEAGTTWTAVCVLDLDVFKGVNDSLGHAAGDDLLRACSGRLAGLLRDGDTVARLGGDEFGVLIGSLADTDAAIVVARRLRDSIALPVQLAGQRCRVTVSVGVALVEPGREVTIDQVLHEADVAMYAAKATGQGRIRVFAPGMLPAGANATYDEVQAVIAEEGAIAPVFQPLMNLSSGVLVGYEALARFPGREHRQVDEWFGLARSSGCGPAMEAKAIRAALAVPGRPAGTYLALNVSPATLTSDAISEVLPPDLRGIVIEITEETDIEAFELTEVLADLRRRGAQIAIDDAGSGYAGLQRLTSLRPDIVKLDRQLVQDIPHRPEKSALVEAMVGYCRRTGSILVAEGIETLEELTTLADLDVAVGQGWAIARPAADWPPVSPEATAVCTMAYDKALGDSDHDQAQPARAALARATSMLDVARGLRLLAASLGAVEAAFSWLEDGHLVTAAENGWFLPMEVYAIADYPASAECLRSLTPVQIRRNDPQADPEELRLLAEVGLGGVLIVPVVHEGEPVGLLEIFTEDPRHWTRAELQLIRVAEGLVAVAVVRERSSLVA